jgi:hypothetical protein
VPGITDDTLVIAASPIDIRAAFSRGTCTRKRARAASFRNDDSFRQVDDAAARIEESDAEAHLDGVHVHRRPSGIKRCGRPLAAAWQRPSRLGSLRSSGRNCRQSSHGGPSRRDWCGEPAWCC